MSLYNTLKELYQNANVEELKKKAIEAEISRVVKLLEEKAKSGIQNTGIQYNSSSFSYPYISVKEIVNGVYEYLKKENLYVTLYKENVNQVYTINVSWA